MKFINLEGNGNFKMYLCEMHVYITLAYINSLVDDVYVTLYLPQLGGSRLHYTYTNLSR